MARITGASPAPERRLGALLPLVRNEGVSHGYGATGAAKQTDGGALAMHGKTLSIVVPAERDTDSLVPRARKCARAGTHVSACSGRDGSRIGPRGPSGMTAESDV